MVLKHEEELRTKISDNQTLIAIFFYYDPQRHLILKSLVLLTVTKSHFLLSFSSFVCLIVTIYISSKIRMQSYNRNMVLKRLISLKFLDYFNLAHYNAVVLKGSFIGLPSSCKGYKNFKTLKEYKNKTISKQSTTTVTPPPPTTTTNSKNKKNFKTDNNNKKNRTPSYRYWSRVHPRLLSNPKM